MSTAKERQAKRRAKIRVDSELHQAQLLRDRSPHKQHFVVGKLARFVQFHHHLRKASLQKVKQEEDWCILFTELMMCHGKLLERKTASSFMKQQRQERGSSKHSKSAT